VKVPRCVEAVFVQESDVRQGQDSCKSQPAEECPRVPAMEASVRKQEQRCGGHHHDLHRRIRVERERGDQDRCEQPQRLRSRSAVPKVAVEKPRVERDGEHGLEGCPRVQEPGRCDREQKGTEPPRPHTELVTQDERDRCYGGKGDQDRRRTRHEDRESEQRVRDDLRVHADAEIENPAVLEVRRYELFVRASESVRHQVRRCDGLNRLVAEERDREALEAPESRRQEEGESEHEEKRVEAGTSSGKGARRRTRANAGLLRPGGVSQQAPLSHTGYLLASMT